MKFLYVHIWRGGQPKIKLYKIDLEAGQILTGRLFNTRIFL